MPPPAPDTPPDPAAPADRPDPDPAAEADADPVVDDRATEVTEAVPPVPEIGPHAPTWALRAAGHAPDRAATVIVRAVGDRRPDGSAVEGSATVAMPVVPAGDEVDDEAVRAEQPTEALPPVPASKAPAKVFVPAPDPAVAPRIRRSTAEQIGGPGGRPGRGRKRRKRSWRRRRAAPGPEAPAAERRQLEEPEQLEQPVWAAAHDEPATPAPADPRLAAPDWQPAHDLERRRRALRALLVVDLLLAGFYAWWLVQPGRSANVGLYGLLLAAELLNMVQALGFWWTLAHLRPPPRVPERSTVSIADTAVDVLIPTYDEPVEVVEPTVVAALALRGGDVRVALLDDGDRPEMAALAERLGATYLTRATNDGAKAGNLNAALEQVDAPFVAVLDCDHVPDPAFLEVCLAHFDEAVAYVQTPQYYANWRRGGVAAAAWSQQALFYGPIAVGRDATGAMPCCGTNVVFRRESLDSVGGFPPDSLTEDFVLSIQLQEQGWTTRYVPEVLASGLGPEDMGGYVSQQLRWARGCLAALPRVMRARLPLRVRLQYLLSGAYWLTGWTVAVYLLLPAILVLFGAQPVEVTSAGEFFVHWGPYFLASVLTVAVAGGWRSRGSAFALLASNFWIHVLASVLTLGRRRGEFVVTPKQGSGVRQLAPVGVPLVVAALLAAVAAWGLLVDRTPATTTAAAFALTHVAVLLAGIRHALRPVRRVS